MGFINLTPHAICVRYADPDYTDDVETVIEPSGTVARVETIHGVDLPPLGGLPIRSLPKFGPVVGLPGPEEGMAYIVSALVGQRAAYRQDVYVPDTGPDAIRENGQVVAVRRLLRVCE